MRLRYLEPMGVFKSIADKAKEQRDELAKKAAKKAARTALEQGAKAAMGAIDAAGNAIEKVIFGDSEREAPSKKGRGRGDEARGARGRGRGASCAGRQGRGRREGHRRGARGAEKEAGQLASARASCDANALRFGAESARPFRTSAISPAGSTFAAWGRA
jgi:hypothetical protein